MQSHSAAPGLRRSTATHAVRFVLGPSALLGAYGLLREPDRTVPTPARAMARGGGGRGDPGLLPPGHDRALPGGPARADDEAAAGAAGRRRRHRPRRHRGAGARVRRSPTACADGDRAALVDRPHADGEAAGARVRRRRAVRARRRHRADLARLPRTLRAGALPGRRHRQRLRHAAAAARPRSPRIVGDRRIPALGRQGRIPRPAGPAAAAGSASSNGWPTATANAPGWCSSASSSAGRCACSAASAIRPVARSRIGARYLKDLFDRYEPVHGDTLTHAEDIFIGFALGNEGYRNIQLRRCRGARAAAPSCNTCRCRSRATRWPTCRGVSISTRCCTRRCVRRGTGGGAVRQPAPGHEQRRIAEPYRQPFGERLTREQGRPIGWVLVFTALEKLAAAGGAADPAGVRPARAAWAGCWRSSWRCGWRVLVLVARERRLDDRAAGADGGAAALRGAGGRRGRRVRFHARALAHPRPAPPHALSRCHRAQRSDWPVA